MMAVTFSWFTRWIYSIFSTLFGKICPLNHWGQFHLQLECFKVQFGTLSVVKIKMFWDEFDDGRHILWFPRRIFLVSSSLFD